MRKELLFATLAIVVSGAAFAGDASFSGLDADSDGTISKAEAAALPALNDLWNTYDQNADGKLDEAEFARFEVPAEGGS